MTPCRRVMLFMYASAMRHSSMRPTGRRTGAAAATRTGCRSCQITSSGTCKCPRGAG